MNCFLIFFQPKYLSLTCTCNAIKDTIHVKNWEVNTSRPDHGKNILLKTKTNKQKNPLFAAISTPKDLLMIGVWSSWHVTHYGLFTVFFLRFQMCNFTPHLQNGVQRPHPDINQHAHRDRERGDVGHWTDLVLLCSSRRDESDTHAHAMIHPWLQVWGLALSFHRV